MELSKLGLFGELHSLEDELPLNLWLSLVIDALAGILPQNSALLGELAKFHTQITSPSFNSNEEAKIRQGVNTILNHSKSLVHLYGGHDLLEDVKKVIERDLNSASQRIKSQVDSIDQQIKSQVDAVMLKHWSIKALGFLLLSLIFAFIGIDYWLSSKVTVAQQKVSQMQEQVNGAKLTIYEKASELNKTLDDAREALWRDRKEAADVLANDRDKARRDLAGVADMMKAQIKGEGDQGSKLVRSEADAQVERVRQESAQKIAHINHGWALWTLGTPWLTVILAVLALLVAIAIRIKK